MNSCFHDNSHNNFYSHSGGCGAQRGEALCIGWPFRLKGIHAIASTIEMGDSHSLCRYSNANRLKNTNLSPTPTQKVLHKKLIHHSQYIFKELEN